MLCDYSKAYIHVNKTMTVSNTATADAVNEKVILKNCAPFTNCIREISNNTQVFNTKDLGIVMPMYPLLECNNNYSKTPEIYIIIAETNQLNNNSDIVDFTNDNSTDLFKFRE